MNFSIRLIIIAALTIVPSLLIAQTRALEVGINGGFNFSSLRGNSFIAANHHLRSGYAGGAFFKYNAPKYYSIQTGISLERKGSTFEVPDSNRLPSTISGKENFDFLVIPVSVRITFGQRPYYFISAGFYYGYLLKETTTTAAISMNNTDYYKRNELGYSAGFGISYPIREKIIISLDAINNFALNDISKSETLNGGHTKTYSTNFLLGVAYKIGRGSIETK